MRLLHIDIETSPHKAYVWGLKMQNVALSQLIEPTRVLCAAWSWEGEGPVGFAAEWQKGGAKAMLRTLYALLDEADAVCHYNGASFDTPHLYREFFELGYGPPAPFAQVDLYRTVARRFRFASHKLAYLADVLALGDEGKLHTSMELWTRVLDGDADAQAEMERYNIEDVVLLKELYRKLRPWVPQHPNVGLYDADPAARQCISCGSRRIDNRGFVYTPAGRYRRLRCKDCSRYMREATRDATTPLREARLS